MELSYKAECAPVVQTKSLTFAEVREINRQVNRDIRPVTEPAGADVWMIGVRDGDCDDYVMTKRHQLIRAGLGSDRARVAVGVAKGQLHAVLVVSFGPHFYVLDNLTDAVLPVERSDVRILSVQSPENPRVWLAAPGTQARSGQMAAAAPAELKPPR